ncbi:hypothetical protein VP01_1004g13 [Puccinia sorghi]|uniref:Uncharacterized protein n=1 Tax=Puccinia sorghi TaxID=27349 RepID=A0A0L6VWP0_9BASI|nr:hypothetical protein VP01_1004g13 [Puccinia sorghi]
MIKLVFLIETLRTRHLSSTTVESNEMEKLESTILKMALKAILLLTSDRFSLWKNEVESMLDLQELDDNLTSKEGTLPKSQDVQLRTILTSKLESSIYGNIIDHKNEKNAKAILKAISLPLHKCQIELKTCSETTPSLLKQSTGHEGRKWLKDNPIVFSLIIQGNARNGLRIPCPATQNPIAGLFTLSVDLLIFLDPVEFALRQWLPAFVHLYLKESENSSLTLALQLIWYHILTFFAV